MSGKEPITYNLPSIRDESLLSITHSSKSRNKPISSKALLSNNMSLTKMLPAALSLIAIRAVDAAMGPAFSTGPVAESSWIREAEATLVLPEKPKGNNGDASLWVGMGTSNGDLIQSIAEAYQSEDWTVFAYTLMSTSGMISLEAAGGSQVESSPVKCILLT